MTNKERADLLAVTSRQDKVSCVDLANLIEQALNESERRGAEEMRKTLAVLFEDHKLSRSRANLPPFGGTKELPGDENE